MSIRLQKKQRIDDYSYDELDQPTMFMDPLNLPENKKSFVLVSREREENLQQEIKSIKENVSEIFRMMVVMSNQLTCLNTEVASIKSQIGQGMVLPSTVAAQETATPSNPPLKPVEQKPIEKTVKNEQIEERVPSPLIIEETIPEDDDEDFLSETIEYIEESDTPVQYEELEVSVPENKNPRYQMKIQNEEEEMDLNKMINWPIVDHEEFFNLQDRMLEDNALRNALVKRFRSHKMNKHFHPEIFSHYSAAGYRGKEKIENIPLLRLLAESLASREKPFEEIIRDIDREGFGHRNRVRARTAAQKKKKKLMLELAEREEIVIWPED